MKNFEKLAHFIKYNNTFTIIFALIFLGGGGAFAASPDLQEGIYASTEIVQSVDNTYIANVDVDSLGFSVQVGQVKEDEDRYYVSYAIETVKLVNGVWQPVEDERVMNVPKSALAGGDLGTYLTTQLLEVRDFERQKITQTQVVEREYGVTTKVIATEYSGLVGRFLDPEEKEFPGYEPVVEAPAPVLDLADPVVFTKPLPDESDDEEEDEQEDEQNNEGEDSTVVVPPVATSTPVLEEPATTTAPVEETPIEEIEPPQEETQTEEAPPVEENPPVEEVTEPTP